MSLVQPDIFALSELLKQSNDYSDSEDEMPKPANASLTPGNVGKRKDKITGNKKKPELKTIKKDSKDIWDDEEVLQGSEFHDADDIRPEPKYEILYKQAVTPEDMYLQMGNKTNATASCENMLIKIYLPSTKLSDIDLEVKENFLDCRTSKYKLGLFLPHRNDSKACKAQWDNSTNCLSVTLRLVREYDEFNF